MIDIFIYTCYTIFVQLNSQSNCTHCSLNMFLASPTGELGFNLILHHATFERIAVRRDTVTSQ